MPYQYVRTSHADESDRLCIACETPTEQSSSGLARHRAPLGELCALTSKNVLWQLRQLRIKGRRASRQEEQGPRGADVEPRAGAPGAPFRAEKAFPSRPGVPGHRQGGGKPRGDLQGRESALY